MNRNTAETILHITIDPEDIYGYAFHDDCFLIITEQEETVTRWLHLTRHGGEDVCRITFPCSSAPQSVPQNVYFRTEESWYGLRISDFEWVMNEGSCTAQFILYKIKAQYMACAALASYDVILHGEADGKHILLLSRQ